MSDQELVAKQDGHTSFIAVITRGDDQTKTVTNNPSLFLAIRQLLTAYGIPVRRATGFPIIQGVLDALFEDNQ
jgi:hypothetical protein